MTADDKHYLLKRDNLTLPIQMELSQKQNLFSQFIFCIFKINIKFYTFSKKDGPNSASISEIHSSEKRG